MELINRQDAIKALRDTFLGDTYEIDVVACGTIECLKTVEAIPIEWLEEKMTGHPELPYAITDGIINVLDLWKAEQEEQSEET